MTDRELLELAAKAAGLRIKRKEDHAFVVWNECNEPWYWNPLEDDGDALRLAVKLRLVVDASDYPSIDVQYKHSGKYWILTEDSGDASASARRAIVRAAAAIG